MVSKVQERISLAMVKSTLTQFGACDGEAVALRPDDLLEHLGEEKAEAMAATVRDCIKAESGQRCTMLPISLVRKAMATCVKNTKQLIRDEQYEQPVIYKKRKGAKRVEYTCVNERFLLVHKSPEN